MRILYFNLHNKSYSIPQFDLYCMQGEPEKSKGTNIIAIMPGVNWGTKDDEIVVVGAHWDSVDDSPGKSDCDDNMKMCLQCEPRHNYKVMYWT